MAHFYMELWAHAAEAQLGFAGAFRAASIDPKVHPRALRPQSDVGAP
jgi:hypothetical protein